MSLSNIPVSTAVIATGILVAAANWLRGQLGTAWALLARRFTSSLMIDEHEGSPFFWLLAWCNAHLPDSTHLLALHRRYEVEFGPAPGLYVVRYAGRRLLVERVEYKSGREGEGRPMALLRLSLLGKNRALFQQILREGEALFSPPDARISITVQSDGYWGQTFRENSRTLESVILDADLKQQLLADMTQFLGAEQWYQSLGVPYQRGYLAYGPPGNGKTSLIRALAAHFALPLYVLNLADPALTDSKLAAMLLNTGRSLVLLEDVDAVMAGRQIGGGERRNLTFSGVLNALDGVVSVPGRIVFMTTNHPEFLDPALVRPGRIDQRVLIDNASGEQVGELFDRFFPGHAELSASLAETVVDRLLSMATIQGALLSHRAEPVDAYRALLELDRNPPPATLPPLLDFSGEGSPDAPTRPLAAVPCNVSAR